MTAKRIAELRALCDQEHDGLTKDAMRELLDEVEWLQAHYKRKLQRLRELSKALRVVLI